jgi:hypothetical protein
MRRLARLWSARTAALFLVLAPAFARPVGAHHSFSAEYAAERTATLTGTLARLDWVNPHVWIYVDVKGSDGAVVRWAVECGAPNSMLRRGARKDALAVGAEVVVDGYLAKDGRPAIKGRSLRGPGSRVVYIGSPGTGAPDDPAVAAGAASSPR